MMVCPAGPTIPHPTARTHEADLTVSAHRTPIGIALTARLDDVQIEFAIRFRTHALRRSLSLANAMAHARPPTSKNDPCREFFKVRRQYRGDAPVSVDVVFGSLHAAANIRISQP
jgi:hypothetical protein